MSDAASSLRMCQGLIVVVLLKADGSETNSAARFEEQVASCPGVLGGFQKQPLRIPEMIALKCEDAFGERYLTLSSGDRVSPVAYRLCGGEECLGLISVVCARVGNGKYEEPVNGDSGVGDIWRPMDGEQLDHFGASALV